MAARHGSTARGDAVSRWTVEAGRGVCFDGVRFVAIHREEPALPVEADRMTHYLVECLNRDGMTPDGLYALHMGHEKRKHVKR